MLSILNKYKELLAISIITAVAGIIRLPFLSRGFFAFTYDQGRDFLAVSKIIYEGNLTLIGPTTGIPGFFYGPFWYYFLSPLLLVADGDPQTVAIIFALIGIVTVVGIYFLIRHITENIFISFIFVLIAAMFNMCMLGPILIWNPTLVPLIMILFIFTLSQIFKSPKKIYYFVLGILTLLVAETSAAFGVVLTMYVIFTPVLFPQFFFRKEFFLTIIGGIIVISPRIIFDFRNNFLISKSLINFFKKPPVYGESLSLLERVTQRLSLFFGFFSSTFTNKNNLFAALFLLTLLIIFLFILKNKKNLNLLKRDYLLRYLVFLLFFIFLAFSIFKDRIWDYYLVGIPITFIIIVAIISNYFFKLIKYKIFVISMLTFIT